MERIERGLLEYFDPKIRPFVEHVLLHDELGILPGPCLRVFDACSGCPLQINQRRFDRFKMSVPFAGQSLTWEVIFDCNCPTEPPDFIFGPEDEDFLPPMDEIESLCSWDATKPESLLCLIKELLEYYNQYNVQQASNFRRLQQDLTSLYQQPFSHADDLEFYITGSESRQGPVYLVLRLKVDFSGIPAYLVQGNPGEDQAILTFTYQSPDSSKVTPELHLSPRVENALGGSSCLRIPTFTAGTLLGDYVGNVRQVVQGFEKRKEYVAAFLSHFGQSVLECDLQTFRNMSFLFEWNDFFFTFSVELPLYFPTEYPSFIFQSVYHEVKGRPFMEVITTFPYSPRWSANEMAVRAKAFILDYISKFQRASVLAKGK
ncbi:hypothetical protein BaRGS_00016393 [Batillaria attramentaria]|uniref:BRISC and BRCA1-A complex member 2 n=1 Tax=Batillaria attramentaria TaxID=370345 RepID=A0ABD0KYJ4_9CAEN